MDIMIVAVGKTLCVAKRIHAESVGKFMKQMLNFGPQISNCEESLSEVFADPSIHITAMNTLEYEEQYQAYDRVVAEEMHISWFDSVVEMIYSDH